MTTTPPDIIWTAREAMACAYCWAEFSAPEVHCPEQTPESYWVSITPRARMECRRIANEVLLLAVARKEAVAMLPPNAIRADVRDLIGVKIGVKAHHRLRAILNGVWEGLRSTRNAGANGEQQT